MTTTPHQEVLLDEALEETFPASDVPRAFHGYSEPPAARPGAGQVWKRLLLATDLSERCAEMLLRSAEIARAVGASIDLVHVRERLGAWALEGVCSAADEQEARRFIDRCLSDAAQGIVDAGIPCQTTSLEGSPARQIVAHAQKTGADVIVLGSRGHGGILQALLGNLARRITRNAACAVLVIPLPEGQPRAGHDEGRSA